MGADEVLGVVTHGARDVSPAGFDAAVAAALERFPFLDDADRRWLASSVVITITWA